MKNLTKPKNLHLIISIIIVVPAAIFYGFLVNFAMTDWFDISIETTDNKNILKAIMGLYLAFASLWIVGLFNEKYWKIATICNMLFMLGLGFGRTLSIIFDGFPSTIFVIGTAGELFLGFYAYYASNKFDNYANS